MRNLTGYWCKDKKLLRFTLYPKPGIFHEFDKGFTCFSMNCTFGTHFVLYLF